MRGKGGAIARTASRIGRAGAYLGSRAVPIIGWAMLVMDVFILAGNAARRLGGESAGLLKAEDADIMMGGLDEEAQVGGDVRNFIESRTSLLRIIKQEGGVNSQIHQLAMSQRRLFLERRQGADLIAREPAIDSPQTIVDRLIAKAREADLEGLADRAMKAARESLSSSKSPK